MRTPFNILALPYYQTEDGEFLFAVLKRSDCYLSSERVVVMEKIAGSVPIYQGIAGGVEEGESYLEAAKREVYEESGTWCDELISLDSRASVPANIFPASDKWGKDTYVVQEISFGARFKTMKIELSHEHLGFEWLCFEEAHRKLTFDSNKVALWELKERLLKRFFSSKII